MFYQWLRKKYNSTINSIAFYPAMMAAGFLLLSYIMLHIDFSDFGKNLKSQFSFVTLKDATTARTIAATIAGGILSLTVFSFSMVMILLVQAATNLSNRMLDTMIGNRFQQVVLGFYIGTIVYALFILSTIRDVDSGIYIPALSIYVLITLTIIDIFLFIYFLHYITESVKYQTVINRIHRKAKSSLEEQCDSKQVSKSLSTPFGFHKRDINLEIANYFQGFDNDRLLEHCSKNNLFIEILVSKGQYMLQGEKVAEVYSEKKLTDEQFDEMRSYLDFYTGQPINKNAYYGFYQLMEIAVKALSPGINDPGTAILSLSAIADLLHFRIMNMERNSACDEDGNVRLLWHPERFKEVFSKSVIPIWEYGKDDFLVQRAMTDILHQLKSKSNKREYSEQIDGLYQIALKAKEENMLSN